MWSMDAITDELERTALTYIDIPCGGFVRLPETF